MKKPRIKAVYLDGKLSTEWKYDRKTGVLEFPSNIPTGTKMVIVYRETLLDKIKGIFKKRRTENDRP